MLLEASKERFIERKITIILKNISMDTQKNKSYDQLVKEIKRLKVSNLVLFIFVLMTLIIQIYNAFF
jgi:hypothetical protein